MTGRCWSELHRPLRAVPVLETALSRYSDAHAPDKALYSSWLADSYLDAGEIERASDTVRSSIAVMATSPPSGHASASRQSPAGSRPTASELSVVADFLGSDALHPLNVRR